MMSAERLNILKADSLELRDHLVLIAWLKCIRLFGFFYYV